MINTVNIGIKNRSLKFTTGLTHQTIFMNADITTPIFVFEILDVHSNFRTMVLEQMTSETAFLHLPIDVIQ